MTETHNIVGVHLTDRFHEVQEVQKAFTEFGRFIKTRLGLHEPEKADPSGIILLEMVGPEEKVAGLAARLGAIGGVEVKRMSFEHPL